jgi:uncharacterized BrkB/YihY/UPF0761 family membrane protein
MEARLDRTRRRTAALQERARQIAERAEAERSRRGSVDAVFEMVNRDGEVGGGMIAGALAYRLFIWMLPLALVLVAGLGIAAEVSSRSPNQAARSLGLAGLVSTSVANASKGSARWYALAVGIPVLFLATRSVLRVLIVAHRLVWTDLKASAPRPTASATLRLLGLILGIVVFSGLASAVRSRSFAAGLVATIAVMVVYGGLWLLVSARLPHREVGLRELVPGAIVFGVGAELIQIAAAYVIAPMALNKQGTYGALGVAASLLLGLFLIGRVVVAAAVVNATLAERRARAATR